MIVKVYHGYGHMHDLIVFGHVFQSAPTMPAKFTNNMLGNIFHLLKLFFVKPVRGIKVRLQWNNQVLESITEKDGFFKFEWKSHAAIAAGWHQVTIIALDDADNIICTGDGKIFVPHSTQYAIISDIDDTVLVSYSATIFKRLRVLFSKNPHTRKTFEDVATHYRLLAAANTTDAIPNPFFYVSSSEWNLYDYLNEFFKHNHLPKGAFLLNQVKQWYQLIKTGKTKHEGKFIRVARIMTTFPKQQFILLGDNSQKDPEIYASVAEKMPGKVFAVYIRNVNSKKENSTIQLLAALEQSGIHTCMYTNSSEAIAHSKQIGLIA